MYSIAYMQLSKTYLLHSIIHVINLSCFPGVAQETEEGLHVALNTVAKLYSQALHTMSACTSPFRSLVYCTLCKPSAHNYVYKYKNHFSEIKGGVGKSHHNKEREQEDVHSIHNPIPTSFFKKMYTHSDI